MADRSQQAELAARIQQIQGILVTLEVGGAQSLFVMLSSDGAINRLGSGAVDNADRDMYIGRTDDGVFRGLRAAVTPELLALCGQSRADPQPRGKICQLTVGFKSADGREMVTAWRYGSESLGPPPAVKQFVTSAMQATDPWHARQKGMAPRRSR